jgi:hypothetical protein
LRQKRTFARGQLLTQLRHRQLYFAATQNLPFGMLCLNGHFVPASEAIE